MDAAKTTGRALSRRVLLGALGAGALALAACARPPAATPPAAATPQPAATAGPLSATPAPRLGGGVSVLASWSGEEQASFLAMVRPFEEQTGARVQYEGTRDLGAVLTTRVQGGNPPDLAGLPGPGHMAEFGHGRHIVDLATVLDMEALRADYTPTWMNLASVEGRQTGIFIKVAHKGLIWHSPFALRQAGHQIPTTWDDLMALSQRLAETGTAPWSIGLESGATSGWPGTDWIEDIVLRQAGPDVYDQWNQGRLPWGSAEIRRAWQTWGEIVGEQRMVYGGRHYMLATSYADAAEPLFRTPPRAYLHHQASFMPTFITRSNPGMRPGEDFSFFPFPAIDPAFGGAVIAAGDLFGMFRQTEQSSALIRYLASPEAQAIWVRRGGALSANRRVPLDAYPDQLARQSAQTLTTAQIVRFDASDLMPEAMNNAFWQAVLDYVNNPASLESILAQLDRTRERAHWP